MSKTFFLLFVFTGLCAAQPFVVGLKVGVPLTDALSAQSSNTLQYVEDTNRYVIGPYLELKLPFKFSVEADTLYRSYSFTESTSLVNTSTSVGSWEFPVLAKYRLFGGPIRPYLEGGVVFSRLIGVPNVPDLIHRGDYGIALGAGVEVHVLVLHLSGGVRYDGFIFKNFSSANGLLESNRNQAMILFGIGF